jgi:hypothetical protein
MKKTTIALALCLLPASVLAQWLHVKTPGISGSPDGGPNLTAPAPRTADGVSAPDEEVPEYVRAENERDLSHMHFEK